jgi:hypothetical protein
VKNVGNSVTPMFGFGLLSNHKGIPSGKNRAISLTILGHNVLLSEKIKPNNTQSHGLIIAPNDKITWPILGESQGVKFNLTNEPESGGLFIMGCIKYTDQFTLEHATRFCFWRNGPVVDGHATFTHCNSNETAD